MTKEIEGLKECLVYMAKDETSLGLELRNMET